MNKLVATILGTVIVLSPFILYKTIDSYNRDVVAPQCLGFSRGYGEEYDCCMMCKASGTLSFRYVKSNDSSVMACSCLPMQETIGDTNLPNKLWWFRQYQGYFGCVGCKE